MSPGSPASSASSWEEVLAAVEEDVRRTEHLLAPEPDPAAALAPAQLQLPPGGPSLPPLEDMPDIPAELVDRIRDLRVRIVALQLQLRDELATLSAVRSPFAAPASTVSAPPYYLDSRA